VTTLQLRRHADVDSFLAQVGETLVAREAEHNLMLGICGSLHRRVLSSPPYFAVVHDEAGRVIAAALRTPPHQLLLSEIDDLAAVPLIARDVHQDLAGEPLPGVLGPPLAAAALAHEWAALTGTTTRVRMQQRIYRADHADLAARTPPGAMRVCTVADRDLLLPWLAAFTREALPDEPASADEAALVERRLADPAAGFVLWEDGDPRRPVALAGYGGPTAHGMRVAPVYTPPELRGRGYATALVAALTQMLLDRGHRFCFLYTNLANPTSNSIYQRIGYEAVTDAEQWRFD
jgi:predicted GNAT family acetyltransferase